MLFSPAHGERAGRCAWAERLFCVPSKAARTLAVTVMGEPQLLQLKTGPEG